MTLKMADSKTNNFYLSFIFYHWLKTVTGCATRWRRGWPAFGSIVLLLVPLLIFNQLWCKDPHQLLLDWVHAQASCVLPFHHLTQTCIHRVNRSPSVGDFLCASISCGRSFHPWLPLCDHRGCMCSLQIVAVAMFATPSPVFQDPSEYSPPLAQNLGGSE